jgi:hypothetical protein
MVATMPPEPTNLIKAREQFALFEAQMSQPEAIVYLADALTLLEDLRDDGDDKVRLVATNLPLAAARRIQAVIEALLSSEAQIYGEIVVHWRKVKEEFESFNIELPKNVSDTYEKLFARYMDREISLLTESERKALIEALKKNMK